MYAMYVCCIREHGNMESVTYVSGSQIEWLCNFTEHCLLVVLKYFPLAEPRTGL